MLPKIKTQSKVKFDLFNSLIYGGSGIGKSTFASGIQDNCFLLTEKINHLEIFREDITDWEGFKATCREIAAGKHQYKHFTIDTIGNLYQYCREYVLKQLNVKHESDGGGYSKGFDLVNGEFRKVMVRFFMLPYGMTIVAHTREDEIDTRTGKYKKTSPDLPKTPRNMILANMDLVLYCDIENTKEADGSVTTRRVIRTKPSLYYEAKCKGVELPDTIALNYDKFVVEFNKGIQV